MGCGSSATAGAKAPSSVPAPTSPSDGPPAEAPPAAAPAAAAPAAAAPAGSSGTSKFGLTQIAKNDEGLKAQPASPKFKMALVQIYVRSAPYGGSDKSSNGHRYDSLAFANGMIFAAARKSSSAHFRSSASKS